VIRGIDLFSNDILRLMEYQLEDFSKWLKTKKGKNIELKDIEEYLNG
jgi:hypothetical protein